MNVKGRYIEKKIKRNKLKVILEQQKEARIFKVFI